MLKLKLLFSDKLVQLPSVNWKIEQVNIKWISFAYNDYTHWYYSLINIVVRKKENIYVDSYEPNVAVAMIQQAIFTVFN